MALIEETLDGVKIDKVQTAIQRLKSFEPEEGYFLAYSGGKDSTCLLALSEMAGVKFDVHYSVTTVDPPELVRFIISQFDTVIYNRSEQGRPDQYFRTGGERLLTPITKEEVTGRTITFDLPKMAMNKLIVNKNCPPTRIYRYCCNVLKETKGDGRIVATGVRWAESLKRKENQGAVTIIAKGKKRTQKMLQAAQENGADYKQTKLGGIVLNYDNAEEQRTVEFCYRTNKTLVNPIIDWTDEDVWEFIRGYKIPYCKLYDEGKKRLGCIGCPQSGGKSMEKDLARYPHMRMYYLKAFEEMIKKREDKQKDNDGWETADDVMLWWLDKKRRMARAKCHI